MRPARIRTKRGVAALLAVATTATLGVSSLASGATVAPRKGAKTPGFTLDLGYISTGTSPWDGPEGFAYAQGKELAWLRPLGVTKISFLSFTNGPLLQAALQGGSVELGELGDTPSLIGKSDGIPERLVNQYTVGMDAWLVGAKGVTSLKQLVGKTVATSSGSYMYRYLLGLLANEHLESKVTVTNLLPAEALPALEKGSVAAIAEAPEAVVSLVDKGYPIVDRASEHTGLEGTSLTVVSSSFLAAHPGFVAGWNEAHEKAVQYADANANAYYDFEAKTEDISVQEAKLVDPLSEDPPQAFTTKGLTLLKGTLNFLAGLKLAKNFSIASWKVSSS